MTGHKPAQQVKRWAVIRKGKEMKLRTERMASGSLYIVLQEEASWDTFAQGASEWIERIGAKLINKADSVDERLWEIEYSGITFWIAYDDFQSSITLEPKQKVPDSTIEKIVTQIESSVQPGP
jgi:hypothetical protein